MRDHPAIPQLFHDESWFVLGPRPCGEIAQSVLAPLDHYVDEDQGRTLERPATFHSPGHLVQLHSPPVDAFRWSYDVVVTTYDVLTLLMPPSCRYSDDSGL
jgi:hypothetical protein